MNNTRKTFEVELLHTQFSKATVTIEAENEAEAREKADELEADEIEFVPFDGELQVVSVS